MSDGNFSGGIGFARPPANVFHPFRIWNAGLRDIDFTNTSSRSLEQKLPTAKLRNAMLL